jgi:2-polyprenyl-6-hydroxyphenyl methylase/3-demethylubiquinone-9 3-methyltransferase
LQSEANYYAQNLNAQKLYQVYDTNIPRVKQYLNAEIHFIQRQLAGTENVIEMGAGYGRILKQLAPYAKRLVGIDISDESIKFGGEYLKDFANIHLEKMDVHKIDFIEEFDVVLCLQNALSAVKGDVLSTINRCMRALVKGGKGYFSTYSYKFWEHRIAWFEEQADKKLLGEIDRQLTKDGVIVCKDGFQAIIFSEKELRGLGEASGYSYEIQEVDESSLFLIIIKNNTNIEP